MKKLIKLVAIVLTAFLFCSILSGCDFQPKPEPPVQFNTIHGGSVLPTEKEIVKDGVTDYVIVVPNDATDNVKKSASALNFFFYEATQISLKLFTDEEVGAWNENLKVFSLGDTQLATSAGVAVDKGDLKECGFYIKTVGNSIFIYGGDMYGVNYGVFELMGYLFNMDYYAENCFSINRGVKNLNLINFDVKEVPDFFVREAFSGLNRRSDDDNYLISTRQTTEVRYEGNLSSSNDAGVTSNIHNALYFVDPARYYQDHPEWFSEQLDKNGVPSQPCYSRDPEGIAQVVADEMKKSILHHKNISMFLYGSMDVSVVCSCSVCQSSIDNYGTSVASYIKVVNKISQLIDEWWDSGEVSQADKNGRNAIKICMLAYPPNDKPPVTKDESEKGWKPVDDSVVLRKNVVVVMALIDTFRPEPYSAKSNEYEYTIIKQWKDIANETMMWYYNVLFGNYFALNDGFNATQQDYQTLYLHGTQYIYDLGIYNETVGTCFNSLKIYLQGKLGWNVCCDYDALIERWFDGYFEDASQPMKEYFNAMRAKTQEWIAKGLIYRGVSQSTYTSTTLYGENPGLITSLLGYFEQAYQAIKPLEQSNPQKYSVLYNRILLESLSPRYVYLDLYTGEAFMPAENARKLRQEFKADCDKFGFTNFSEHININQLWSRWNVN